MAPWPIVNISQPISQMAEEIYCSKYKSSRLRVYDSIFSAMVYTVKSADTGSGKKFIGAVDAIFLGEKESQKRVAFDCEGVNLSRLGSLEIISIWMSTSST